MGKEYLIITGAYVGSALDLPIIGGVRINVGSIRFRGSPDTLCASVAESVDAVDSNLERSEMVLKKLI